MFIVFSITLILFLVLILVQTWRYYNVDIFQDACEMAKWLYVQQFLNDADYLQYMNATEGTSWQHPIEINSYWRGCYTLAHAAHRCQCQPCVLYSPDKRYKATVYHAYWKYNFFNQKNRFTVTFERVTS